MRPLTFMISQRRGYSFSECETRVVELLGNLRAIPKGYQPAPRLPQRQEILKARHA
jgi:arsenical pump membrane protein